jgi:hypothetical protein
VGQACTWTRKYLPDTTLSQHLFWGGSLNSENYPAVFRSADEGANRNQRLYLWLIRIEYGLLFVAAVLSMQFFAGATFYLIYACVFLAALIVLLSRALIKPEQDWYRCRALAESVKTLTWRYMMGAQPFSASMELTAARDEFRQHLERTFKENRSTAEKMVTEWSDADQITAEMDRVRGLSLTDRKKLYANERVGEQRSWYSRKASANRKAGQWWVGAGILAYCVAALLALGRIEFPHWYLWPIQPVIVFASSIIGWMHIKKFSELKAAYTVAAHEIGLIKPRLEDVANELEFSTCVNDAELAFSREHTMWIARQSN